MNLLKRITDAMGLGGTSTSASPVEWGGEIVEAALGAGMNADRCRLAQSRRRRNVWAVLRPTVTKTGNPKVEVFELGGIRGGSLIGGAKLGQAQVREGSPLDSALRSGVQVGVVQLSADVVDMHGNGVEYSALLVLGRGYKFRPAASWD